MASTKISGNARAKFPDNTWRTLIEVCNETDREITVIVTSNPYDKKGNKFYPQDKPDEWDKQSVTLPPKKCKTITFGPHDKEPKGCYADVYLNEEDRKSRKMDTYKLSADYQWAMVQRGSPNEFAFSFPFPVGASGTIPLPLNALMNVDLQGLPENWVVSDITPPARETLQFNSLLDRHVISGTLTPPEVIPEGISGYVRFDFFNAASGEVISSRRLTFPDRKNFCYAAATRWR